MTETTSVAPTLADIEAPAARVAESFGRATPIGMKIVERMPSSRAANATPCAWLPADAATTPRDLSSSMRFKRRLSAPRLL